MHCCTVSAVGSESGLVEHQVICEHARASCMESHVSAYVNTRGQKMKDHMKTLLFNAELIRKWINTAFYQVLNHRYYILDIKLD